MFPGMTEDDAATKVTKESGRSFARRLGLTRSSRSRRPTANGPYVADSKYNRRITGMTAFAVSGPAAGHKLLQTSADRPARQ
jgi:secreted PhoX family phosphatase